LLFVVYSSFALSLLSSLSAFPCSRCVIRSGTHHPNIKKERDGLAELERWVAKLEKWVAKLDICVARLERWVAMLERSMAKTES
jgi:hypothetical protein